MRAVGLTIVGASAGSGKTHRLTEEVLAIRPGAGTPLPLEALIAVTYTRKAQAELAARIRRTLVEAGAFDESVKLPLATLGTVHAACLRLIEELAIDAGLSPHVEPLGGDPARLLRESIENALEAGFRARMEELAARLQIEKDDRVQRTDWLRPVGEIMELARSNRIDPARLPEMGRRSADGLLGLLPPATRDGKALDDTLADALETLRPRLGEATDCGIKMAAEAAEIVRQAAAKRSKEGLGWADWLRLSRLKPGKAMTELFEKVCEAASAYERHPRFHADLRDFAQGAFDAARVGLDAYARWKTRRRLIDYTDMIDRALTLLEDPAVARELASRLRLAVVDEFQDTSPLQLAFFVRLHALAGRSVWVGDRKQCIFEFAGADPLLMEAVTRWAKGAGGATEQLPTNYRSRPELVRFTSELFARAFAEQGHARREVAVAPHRPAVPGLAGLPPTGVWWLDTGKKEADAAAIAAGVARLLREPAATPVVDRRNGEVRALRPGDIAVLVATNAEAQDIATALYGHGIHAALPRPGLLATPEGTLIDAALRLLLDSRDTLSAAVLDALAGWNGLDPDRWLAGKLAAGSGPAVASPWVIALDALRPAVASLSPTEALDRVIVALDAETACARWPDPAQRLANLDALRALALAYEERCRRRREIATPAGLLRYFDEARKEVLIRDEELATDDQHVREGDDAVTISTYHRAKGLEWPVVILGSLDRKERRNAFDVCPESDRPGFDAEDPLGDRWIRYWPFPFANATTAPLFEAAARSPEGQRVAERENRERIRLLYVGFTRARDHLVLAIRRREGKAPNVAWLGELEDLNLPADTAEGTGALTIGSRHPVPARIWTLQPTAPAGRPQETPRQFERAAAVERPRYWIAPSRAAEEWPDLPAATVGEIIPLAHQFQLSTHQDWDAAGTALHAFFAADVEDLPTAERLTRAERLVTPYMLPADAIAAADALRAFIATRWPGARWHREVPLTALIAGRRVEGAIDLLLETPAGHVIIDHKSYAGRTPAAWQTKAQELAPQLTAYATALRQMGHTIVGTWLHFPVRGAMVEIALSSP